MVTGRFIPAFHQSSGAAWRLRLSTVTWLPASRGDRGWICDYLAGAPHSRKTKYQWHITSR
jgi:hypothetical protein